MFGIGPQEMMLIALVALIIFGPGKLPEVMRETGKHYRKFKGIADEMTGELNKVTAEARKELDGALGDLGPMGKDLEKSLGMKSSSSARATTTGTKSTTSSTARKTTTSTSSTSSAKRTTTSSSSSKTTSSAKPVTDSRSHTAAAKAGKPKQEVATKSDPLADFMVFEMEPRENRRRSRSAAPSSILDPTPRFDEVETPEPVAVAAAPADLATIDDPLARARARRRTAGYARA